MIQDLNLGHQLKLGQQVGVGAFGVVLEGVAEHIKEGEERTKVAVKMIKKCANNQEFRALVSELKILTHLGQHSNIVNLLEAVTKNIVNEELLVILEFCAYGNIANILKSNRKSFISLINFETDDIHLTLDHLNVSWSIENEPKNINTLHLISWSYQIACGMNYLSSKKLLHCDLAARNILLSENNIVKICDFGLANSLYDKTYYRKSKETPLPIRWLALEALEDNIFTTRTDIWAYGVVLWELFSLGQKPYSGMNVDNNFYLKLKEGYRLEKPPFANNEIYKVMWKCWNADPIERPLFMELMARFAEMLSSIMSDSDMVANELYGRMV